MNEKTEHDDLGVAFIRGCRSRSLRRRAHETNNISFAYSNWEAICFIKDLRWALCGSVCLGNFGKLALAALNDR